MITIKYFENFLEHERIEEECLSIANEKHHDHTTLHYDKDDGTFNFELAGNEGAMYHLKIFLGFEVFNIKFPNNENNWCSIPAFKKNRDYFKSFENGLVYLWIFRSITYVYHKIYLQAPHWDIPNEGSLLSTLNKPTDV
jgi:hypothetical protein